MVRRAIETETLFMKNLHPASLALRRRPTIALQCVAGATMLACMLGLATTASSAPTRVDQLVRTALELEADTKHGASAYVEQCSRCHGMTAFGNAANVIPALAGQRTAYLSRQRGPTRDRAQLRDDGSLRN